MSNFRKFGYCLEISGKFPEISRPYITSSQPIHVICGNHMNILRAIGVQFDVH